MRVVLFNLQRDVCPDGAAVIASLLRSAGHHVTRVTTPRIWSLRDEPGLEEDFDSLLLKIDLVLIAVYSAGLTRAVEITEMIHRRHKHLKVIWGGPHCVSAPEESLQYADGVCYAEGDTIITELVDRFEKGTNWIETPNMAFMVDGKVVRNPVVPPLQDLDSLPFPDMDVEDHYILEPRLKPLTEEEIYSYNARWPLGKPMLPILTSRGCPYVCSYCNNVRYVHMHGSNRPRYHSIEYIIRMLETMLAQHKLYEIIFIYDDDFFCRSLDDLTEFAEKYKKRIGLPFIVNATANSFRQAKFDLLLAAGLTGIEIGVQSGSQRMLTEVYNRRISADKKKEVILQIATPENARKGLGFLLADFIVDCPYEKPEDIMATYNFLLDLHPLLSNRGAPWVSALMFYLTLTPGTPLMDRAVREGLVKHEDLQGPLSNYHRRDLLFQVNYETALVMLVRYLNITRRLRFVPCFVLRLLGTRPARWVGSKVPASFYAKLTRLIRFRVLC